MSRLCDYPEQLVMVANGGAACGSNAGSSQGKEVVAEQVGCPELGGLPVLAGGPSQPPRLAP